MFVASLKALQTYFPSSSLIPWIRATHPKFGYAVLALLLVTPILHFGIPLLIAGITTSIGLGFFAAFSLICLGLDWNEK